MDFEFINNIRLSLESQNIFYFFLYLKSGLKTLQEAQILMLIF